MNRARRKTYKRGRMNRLVNESLLLSCTRFLSSRVVRFFETGFASPLLKSAKKVDDFAKEKVTGPLFKKTELRKNFAMPLRNSFALLFSRNRVFNKLSGLVKSAMNLSLRSIGVFLFVFAIYASGIFLLKRYIATDLGVANTDDLALAAVTLIVGLILTVFGDKSIISALSTGRITGSLLNFCLGVNESSLVATPHKATKTSVGISFLLGSISGAMTLFSPPSQILLTFGAVLIFLAVLHIPEFGLLSAVATFTFVPVSWTAALTFAATVSFLLKCLRLKRNFRFGTADALILVMFFILYFRSKLSGGIDESEKYILLFTAMYFPAKNLISSERLLVQTFNALCVGLRVGMALYIFSEFSMYISHDDLHMAADWVTSNLLGVDMLVFMSAITLPFAFSMMASGSRRAKLLTVLLTIACAVVVDSFVFYALAFISFFVYVMMAYKAPVGALLGAALVLTPAFSVIAKVVSKSGIISGVRVADSAVAIVTDMGTNFWNTFISVNGIVCIGIFAIALIFILQRVLGCMAIHRSRRVSVFCGTVLASVIMSLVGSFMFNPFSDLRVYAAIWFLLGLCGAVYQICSQPQYGDQEV